MAPSAQKSEQLEELALAIEDLRRRVAALERADLPANPAVLNGDSAAAANLTGIPFASSSLLPGIGVFLLGIAGAYLLRAITEARIFTEWAGTALGIAYAFGWLVWPARILAGRRLSAVLQAIIASCILMPLLWEATIRFHTLSAPAVAAVLSVFMIVGQMIAWRQVHPAVAGITAMAGCAAAIPLIIATLHPLPFAAALLLAAAAVEYGVLQDRALSWRWIVALTVDLCALLLVYLVSLPQGLPEGYAPIPLPEVVALLIGVVVVYLSTVVARTAFRSLRILWFELFQVVVVLGLAIGGALRLSKGDASMLTGALCLALSLIWYAAAILCVKLPARNFHAYASLGLVLALLGGVLLSSAITVAVLWPAMAVAAVLLGRWHKGNVLAMHGSLFLLAAAANSGLLKYTARALTQPSPALHFSAGTLFCAIAAALCSVQTMRARKPTGESWANHIAPTLLAGILCWSVAGLSAGLLNRFNFSAQLASTIRTALISIVAFLLAWVGRRWELCELVWLLFPWMLFGAAELVVEDFAQGRAATLFLSLLLYGGTLIALPRLLRSGPVRDAAVQKMKK